jgi:hypothetical protein
MTEIYSEKVNVQAEILFPISTGLVEPSVLKEHIANIQAIRHIPIPSEIEPLFNSERGGQ